MCLRHCANMVSMKMNIIVPQIQISADVKPSILTQYTRDLEEINFRNCTLRENQILK